jgi:ADP-ribose pyrophosphatase YjhB (NUDIX family)
MIIKSTFTNNFGQLVRQTYYDEGDLDGVINENDFGGVHAFCFCEGKMVLVNHPKIGWTPPGGAMEQGESYIQTTEREVKEETNMKVLHQELIGYSIFERPDKIVKQTRSFCIVEPNGEFVSDPDGEIMEIKLIDPLEYKKYFDWGETGDRIMQRAIELYNNYSK